MRAYRLSFTVLVSIAILGTGLVFAVASASAMEGRVPLSFSPFGSFTRYGRSG